MTRTLSLWRAAARERIAAILAELPATATDKDRRRALREASPGKSPAHGYRMWLKEVRLAIGDRRKPKMSEAPSVRFILFNKGPNLRTPWLDVRCSWCCDQTRYVNWFGNGLGGVQYRVPCLMCASAIEAVARITARPEWLALQQAAADGDEVATLACRDFLIDQGIEVEEAKSCPLPKSKR